MGSKEECLAWAAGGTELGSAAGWRSHSVDTSVREVKGQTKTAWQSAVCQACRHAEAPAPVAASRALRP